MTTPVTPAESDAALVELLGFTAYLRLGLFGLIAKQTYDAPGLRAAQRMATIGVRLGEQQQDLLDVGASFGLDPVALMRPFGGVFNDFEAATPVNSWWEGTLKAVVGHGVAGDLARTLAAALPAEYGEVIAAALVHADRDQDLRVTQMVADAAAADPELAGRLSLWGRTVVGEALILARKVMSEHPLLGALAAEVKPGDADEDWLFALLKDEHAARMARMGLAA